MSSKLSRQARRLKGRKGIAKRDPLVWPTITPKNRREIEKQYAEDWKRRNKEAGNPDEHTPEKVEEIANIVGKMEVRKIKKGTKAYLRGETSFNFYGERMPIETASYVKGQVEFMKMQAEMMKKQKEKQEESKSEEE